MVTKYRLFQELFS